MYEDEYLDDEIEEGLDELDDGSSNSNISDRIKESLNKRNQEDDLKDDIEEAKNKEEKENNSSKDNNKNNSSQDNNENNKDNNNNKNNNKQPEDKKNQPQQKPNNPKNKLNGNDSGSNEIKDKLNNAKQKAKQNNPATKKPEVKLPKSTSNSGSMAKEGLKEGAKKGGKVAAEAGKKGAQAAAKGAQAVGKGIIQILSKLPPQVWIVIGVIAAVIFFITLLVVFVGASDEGGKGNYDPTSTDKNQFMCAMINPLTKGNNQEGIWITSFFGHRNSPTAGASSFHRGIDIGISEGSPIYAVQKGKVIQATSTSSSSGYGTVVMIEHENGFVSVYAHMIAGSIPSSVTVGATVSQGQQVGEQGNTGTSTGSHLHFELRDEENERFSTNEYFGVADKGKYANCSENSGTAVSGCQVESREGTINFQEEVCSKYNFDNSSNEIGNIKDGFGFVKMLEGTTKTCTTKDGKPGYMTENIGDGTVTVGFGFTNHPIGAQTYTDIINKSGYSSLFAKNGSHYKMTTGVCIPQTLADEMAQVEYNEMVQTVVNKVNSYELTMNEHQLAALTSFIYQNGAYPLDSLLKAYKYYDNTEHTNGDNCTNEYEGIWSKMSLYFNPDDPQFIEGLKKRRKAEFALFVTGDYSDNNKFYSRNLNNYAYYDSEDVMKRIKK